MNEMSDFTKEELEETILGLSWLQEVREHDDNLIKLIDKIQVMIDKYRNPSCIHEIDTKIKRCKVCGLAADSISCAGGWLGMILPKKN